MVEKEDVMTATKMTTDSSCDAYWMRIQMLSGLAAAYLQETGLPASGVKLVQEKDGEKTVFYFVPAR